jgi:iron complex outermembrane recepter protein
MSKKSKLGWILRAGASIAAMGAVTPAMAQDAPDDVSEEIVVTATGRTAAIQDVPIAVQAINNETLEQSGVQSLTDLTQIAPTLRIGSGQSTTSGTIASIRGIGTGSDNPGFEGAVGIFIDGVYRARAGAALSDLPDVERIEILRGPQGTLFGKNTSSGAISVITAAPSGEFGAWGEFEGGEYEALRTSFGMETPLGDNAAIRFDAAMRGADGYITDVTSNRDINDRDRWTARLQGLFDIGDSGSLRLIVDGGETNENCCGAVNIQTGVVIGPLAAGFFPDFPDALQDPATQEDRNMSVTPARSYAESSEDFGVSAELNFEVGDLNVTSVTASRDWSASRNQDIDFTSIDRAYRDGLEISLETMSQELRVQGENGRLNWLIGGFLSREEIATTDRIRFGTEALRFGNSAWSFLGGGRAYVTNTTGTGCLLVPLGGSCLPDVASGDGQQADNWGLETQSASIFTHNEFSLSDQLVLTLGARLNHETKDMTASLDSVNAACDSLQGGRNGTPDNYTAAQNLLLFSPDSGPLLLALACNAVTNTFANDADPSTVADDDWSDDREETEWSGTASLAYHASDDLMIYGGYSRGYKAGGFNLDRSGFFGRRNLDSAYGGGVGDALTTDDLEFEPEFTDAFELGFKSTVFGNTYFNANVFYQQIHDYQSNAFSGFNFFTLNVPELISQGVELELNSRLTDNLTVSGGVLYNDAYYDSSATYGSATIEEGTTLAQAPEWTVAGSVNYSMPISSTMGLNFFVNGRYVTDYATMTLNRNPITDNEAFAIFDARVSLGALDERWSLEVFARNLTDEFYYVGGFGAPERTLAADSVTPNGLFDEGNYLAYPNAPRTVGVTLRARY